MYKYKFMNCECCWWKGNGNDDNGNGRTNDGKTTCTERKKKKKKKKKCDACAQLRAPGSLPCITRVYVCCSRLINSALSALNCLHIHFNKYIDKKDRCALSLALPMPCDYHKCLDILTHNIRSVRCSLLAVRCVL